MTLNVLKILLVFVMSLAGLTVAGQNRISRANERKTAPARPKAQPFLTVNGEAETTSISFPEAGGSVMLNISTNQGTPSIEENPEWISGYVSSKTSMSIKCEGNPDGVTRSGYFDVKAGSLSVRVAVTQVGQMPEITGVIVGNATWDGDYIDEPGSTLYAEKMRYFTPSIRYNGSSAPVTKTLYVKLIRPDGTLKTVESSPDGFTYSQKVTFLKGNNLTQGLISLGNDAGSTYNSGTYTIEIYCDGNKILSDTVELH